MRALSRQKLEEVEALLERTKAMKGWLGVAQDCGCQSPAECALFPPAGETPIDTELTILHVKARDCRRAPEPA